MLSPAQQRVDGGSTDDIGWVWLSSASKEARVANLRLKLVLLTKLLPEALQPSRLFGRGLLGKKMYINYIALELLT